MRLASSMAMMKGEAARRERVRVRGARISLWAPGPALPLRTQTAGGGRSRGHGTALARREALSLPTARSSDRFRPIRTGLRTHSRANPQPCAPALLSLCPAGKHRVWLCLFPLRLSQNALTPLKPEEKHKLWLWFPNSPLTRSPTIPALVTTAPAAPNKGKLLKVRGERTEAHHSISIYFRKKDIHPSFADSALLPLELINCTSWCMAAPLGPQERPRSAPRARSAHQGKGWGHYMAEMGMSHGGTPCSVQGPAEADAAAFCGQLQLRARCSVQPCGQSTSVCSLMGQEKPSGLRVGHTVKGTASSASENQTFGLDRIRKTKRELSGASGRA